MGDDRDPAAGLERARSQQMAGRAGGGLSPQSGAELHLGAGLRFADGGPGRDECWATLGPKVSSRLEELAGQDLVDWFATTDGSTRDGRVQAGLLGKAAFALALPRWDVDRKPVYSVSCYEFDRDSHRKVTVVGFAPPRDAVAARPEVAQGPTAPQAGRHQPLGMDSTTRGEIGNLPAQAQELLQAPFLSPDEEILRSMVWYSGFPHQLDHYLLVVGGRKSLTAASGTNYVPVSDPGNRSYWELTCHRFNVVRRIGR